MTITIDEIALKVFAAISAQFSPGEVGRELHK